MASKKRTILSSMKLRDMPKRITCSTHFALFQLFIQSFSIQFLSCTSESPQPGATPLRASASETKKLPMLNTRGASYDEFQWVRDADPPVPKLLHVWVLLQDGVAVVMLYAKLQQTLTRPKSGLHRACDKLGAHKCTGQASVGQSRLPGSHICDNQSNALRGTDTWSRWLCWHDCQTPVLCCLKCETTFIFPLEFRFVSPLHLLVIFCEPPNVLGGIIMCTFSPQSALRTVIWPMAHCPTLGAPAGLPLTSATVQ